MSSSTIVLPAVTVLLLGCSCGRASDSTNVRESRDAGRSSAALRHEATRALAYSPGQGQTEDLIRTSQAAARRFPDRAESYVGLATAFIRRSRETGRVELLRLADDAVKAALSRDASQPQARALRILLLQEDHRFTEARDEAVRLLTVRSSDHTAHVLHGDALLELGHYSAAHDAYQRALTLRPDLRSYDRGGYLRWLNGNVEGALELYRLALDAGSTRDPESTAWVRCDIADLEWNRGNLDAAQREVDEALALIADYMPALRLRARLHVARGRRADAVAILEGLVARRHLVEDLLWLAELLQAEGRTEDAEARVEEAVRLRRDDPRALALHYARHRSNPDEALTLAERELRARSSIHSRAVVALALGRLGRTREALDQIGRARSMRTPDARLALYEAVIRLRAGDTAGAREAYAEAMAMNRFADPLLSAELEPALGPTAASGAPAPADSAGRADP